MTPAVATGEACRDLRWSTGDLPSYRRVSDWIARLSDNITEMDVSAATGFAASWERYGLGPLDLNFLSAGPQVVLHTPEMARRSRDATYELVYVRHGRVEVRHCGAAALVPQGNFILLDDQEPFELVFPGDSLCLTTHLPEAWLRRWIPHPKLLTAKPIAGADGWGGPLASLLTTIADQGLERAALPRPVIADQLGALLALMAGQAAEPVASRHQGGLLIRLRRILAERFDDAALDPATVAHEAGISKRHLHGVFAGAGTTFGAALMEVRLSRARDMLSDRRFRAYGVGEIAWACGFADPSHFARRFRQAHGASPMAFRAAVA